MKTLYALLIAALFTIAACGKKQDEAAKTDPAKDPAMQPTEPPKADPATPNPAAAPPTTAPAAAGAMTVDEAGTKALALLAKINTAVTSAGGDCAKMGANLKLLTDEAKAMKAAEKVFLSDPAKKKEFEAKYGEKVNNQTGFAAFVVKCTDDAEVNAFFSSLQ
jgi:hypothetical protein